MIFYHLVTDSLAASRMWVAAVWEDMGMISIERLSSANPGVGEIGALNNIQDEVKHCMPETQEYWAAP